MNFEIGLLSYRHEVVLNSHVWYQESNLALFVSKTLELNYYALLPPQSLD